MNDSGILEFFDASIDCLRQNDARVYATFEREREGERHCSITDLFYFQELFLAFSEHLHFFVYSSSRLSIRRANIMAILIYRVQHRYVWGGGRFHEGRRYNFYCNYQYIESVYRRRRGITNCLRNKLRNSFVSDEHFVRIRRTDLTSWWTSLQTRRSDSSFCRPWSSISSATSCDHE